MDIGSRLRGAIERSGVSIKEFSRVAGIPYRTLQNYLSGDRLPGAEALVQIGHQGIDLNWLLIGEVCVQSTIGDAVLANYISDIMPDRDLHALVINSSMSVVDRYQGEAYSNGIKPISFHQQLDILTRYYKFFGKWAQTLYNISSQNGSRDGALQATRDAISKLSEFDPRELENIDTFAATFQQIMERIIGYRPEA